MSLSEYIEYQTSSPMVFTKRLLKNALAVRPCNFEAVLEPLLPKVARCIPVLSSRYIGKCATRVLKRSGQIYQLPSKLYPLLDLLLLHISVLI